jgi:hypothetical protein
MSLYIDGVRHGTDIGISIAMTAITSERVHQQQMADGAHDQARYVYAESALHAVAQVLGRRFWQ